MQLADLDPRTMLARIVLGLGDVKGLEVRTEAFQIDLDANPLRITNAGAQHAGPSAQAGCTDVETHAEQSQLVEAIVARPARPYRLLEHLAGHSATCVTHDDLSSRNVGAQPGHGHADLEASWPALFGAKDFGEVVESVVDEFRDALPFVELDLAEHPQDARRGGDVHERCSPMPDVRSRALNL